MAKAAASLNAAIAIGWEDAIEFVWLQTPLLRICLLLHCLAA